MKSDIRDVRALRLERTLRHIQRIPVTQAADGLTLGILGPLVSHFKVRSALSVYVRRPGWSRGYHTRHWIRGSRVQTRLG